MEKIFVLFAILLTTGAATAQTLISGQVQDQKGQPVTGANVYLKGTYDGASTDPSGAFRFLTRVAGPQTVGVTYLGHQPQEQAVQLSGQPVEVRFVLQEERNELNAVVITAGSFEASDTRRSTVLKPLDIATTAGATADVAGALNTLPGAQRVGEEGKLFVRGGEAYETRTFIDGLPVQTPYASSVPNVPARGRFSPFLFSGLAFSSGGYSAEYGQALSSALILHTADLAPETVTGVSLMSVGGSLSHTQRWENTSLALTADYSNLRPYFSLVEQQLDWQRPPQSKGGSVIFRHQTSPTGLLKAYGTFSTSGLSLTQPDFSSPTGGRPVDLHNRNLFLNTSYKEILRPKWSLRSGLAFSRDLEKTTYGPLPAPTRRCTPRWRPSTN